MFDQGARIRVRLIHCYIYTVFMPPEVFEMHSDCALIVLACAFSDLVLSFCNKCWGNLVLWPSKVDVSWQAQEIRAVLL